MSPQLEGAGGAVATPAATIGRVGVVLPSWGSSVTAITAPDGVVAGRVVKLAVTDLPGSATPEQLRAWAGIDAEGIARSVRAALSG